jgi:hypothetical protein
MLVVVLFVLVVVVVGKMVVLVGKLNHLVLYLVFWVLAEVYQYAYGGLVGRCFL